LIWDTPQVIENPLNLTLVESTSISILDLNRESTVIPRFSFEEVGMLKCMQL